MAASTKQRGETWNMELKHGDTWHPYTILVKDENGNAITGFDVTCTIVRSMANSNVVKTLTIGDGFTVVGNLITFDAEVDLPKGTYRHDIQITLANGKKHTKYEGMIYVTQDLTP